MELLQEHGHADYRKTLCIWTTLRPGYCDSQLWGLNGHLKAVHGTAPFRLRPEGSPKINIDTFKKVGPCLLSAP